MKDTCKRGHTGNWYVKGKHRACRDCRSQAVIRSRIIKDPAQKLEARRAELLDELVYLSLEIAKAKGELPWLV